MNPEFTPEDQLEYDKLVDPDEHPASNANAEFGWGIEVEQIVLGGLIKDRQFLLQNIDLIKPSYFTWVVHKRIADALIAYFREYKGMPPIAILQAETIKRIPERELDEILAYKCELTMLIKTVKFEVDFSGRDYVAKKILTFAKRQAFAAVMRQAIDIMKRPDLTDTQVDEAHQKLIRSLNITPRYENGLEYFPTLDERFRRMRAQSEGTDTLTTGIPGLDASFTAGGLIRGGAYAIGAPSGDGKSLFLATIGTANLLRGSRVLYVTCELSEDETAQRFDAMLTGFHIRTLLDHEGEVIGRLKEISTENLLLIKQFAPKTATADTIQAYIDHVAILGFKPDVVLVDYLGEMKARTGIPKHEALEELSSNLKALAVANNVVLVSAIQINRDGKKAANLGGKIDDSNLADSYGQVRPLDGFWTLSKSDDERAAHLARLGVSKSRSGEVGGLFWLENSRLLFTEIDKNAYFAKAQSANQDRQKSDEHKIGEYFNKKMAGK